jgi:hypothetical protein
MFRETVPPFHETLTTRSGIGRPRRKGMAVQHLLALLLLSSANGTNPVYTNLQETPATDRQVRVGLNHRSRYGEDTWR